MELSFCVQLRKWIRNLESAARTRVGTEENKPERQLDSDKMDGAYARLTSPPRKRQRSTKKANNVLAPSQHGSESRGACMSQPFHISVSPEGGYSMSELFPFKSPQSPVADSSRSSSTCGSLKTSPKASTRSTSSTASSIVSGDALLCRMTDMVHPGNKLTAPIYSTKIEADFCMEPWHNGMAMAAASAGLLSRGPVHELLPIDAQKKHEATSLPAVQVDCEEDPVQAIDMLLTDCLWDTPFPGADSPGWVEECLSEIILHN